MLSSHEAEDANVVDDGTKAHGQFGDHLQIFTKGNLLKCRYLRTFLYFESGGKKQYNKPDSGSASTWGSLN